MREFQRMRRWRNTIEYDDLMLGTQDVEADLRQAERIVAAVRVSL